MIASFCFLLCFVIVDLKNYLKNGAPFIVNDDIFDKLKFYLNLPGEMVGFLIIIIVYQNIHNYDFYAIETISFISSSILYGWITSIILRRFIGTQKKLGKTSTGV